jgi:hypothetical protein
MLQLIYNIFCSLFSVEGIPSKPDTIQHENLSLVSIFGRAQTFEAKTQDNDEVSYTPPPAMQVVIGMAESDNMF